MSLSRKKKNYSLICNSFRQQKLVKQIKIQNNEGSLEDSPISNTKSAISQEQEEKTNSPGYEEQDSGVGEEIGLYVKGNVDF